MIQQHRLSGAMDAAGPVDGANGRAAHKVLGNRFAISTAPTAQTEGLSTTATETQSTRPPNRGSFTTRGRPTRAPSVWECLIDVSRDRSAG